MQPRSLGSPGRCQRRPRSCVDVFPTDHHITSDLRSALGHAVAATSSSGMCLWVGHDDNVVSSDRCEGGGAAGALTSPGCGAGRWGGRPCTTVDRADDIGGPISMRAWAPTTTQPELAAAIASRGPRASRAAGRRNDPDEVVGDQVDRGDARLLAGDVSGLAPPGRRRRWPPAWGGDRRVRGSQAAGYGGPELRRRMTFSARRRRRSPRRNSNRPSRRGSRSSMTIVRSTAPSRSVPRCSSRHRPHPHREWRGRNLSVR